MPDDLSDPHHVNSASVEEPTGNRLLVPSRLSFKAGLAVLLLVGLLLFLLSNINYLLIHTLTEIASIILLTAVFLIGWNTRRLVSNQFFVILATGFLVTGAVDLLHTLTYKGMHVLPVADADTATQLWLVARTLSAFAFLCATFSLGRKELCSARSWLCGFLLLGGALTAMVWPLGVCPTCIVEGQGLTLFKVSYEYVLIGLLVLSAWLLHLNKKHLSSHIVTLLYFAIGSSILAELMFTLYVDVFGLMNFTGHFFKLGSTIFVYLALVDGTLYAPFATLFRDMGQSYQELNQELYRRIAAEKQRAIAHQEVSALYRMSQALHSTLNLDELAHLMLSAATSVNAGGFERATLFTVNKRTGMLQGMLGVSQEMASLIVPCEKDPLAWEKMQFDEQAREMQRATPFNQQVIKQRLPLQQEDNALARAIFERQVVLVSKPKQEPESGQGLAEALDLGPYACAPLIGRDQIMGVMLVDNPRSGQEVTPSRKRFLELYASQAGLAMDNAGLVKRLEMAHNNLRDIQEQLIHGEKMAVLGEMAAQVAHELRNPLVSIGGFAQRLARQQLVEPKANEYARIIAREVKRMEELLGNILAFSKKQLVCLDDCSISDVLHEVIALEEEQCQRQNIILVKELENVLPQFTGDSRQLHQVFLNLMINARQVMSGGGVLTIRARLGALRGDEAIVVEIEDTGGGISPEIMRNIFNPFFSSFAKGTGLGLSISHRIIAHHHGEIEVINGDKGARFIVTIPLVPPGILKIDSNVMEQVN
ncbi:MAG: MASE3 domain-containing protein [Desulfuromonadales bacterium]